MRFVLIALAVFSGAALAPAGEAPARVERIAGGGDGGSGSAATAARLVEPFGIAFDGSGSYYVCEYKGERISRVDRRGILTHFAGAQGQVPIPLNDPHGVVIARKRTMYVADTLNHRVVGVDLPGGPASIVAGTGSAGYFGDGGPAARAAFNGVYGIDADRSGRALYVADLANRRVRAIDLRTATVRTVAGNGERGIPRDGARAAESPLVDPRAVAADSKGNVYILERSGNALRVVDRKGRIRTLLGPERGEIKLNGPKHLCIDRRDNVIIADSENHRIVRYSPTDGRTAVIAGTGEKGDRIVAGDPLRTQMNRPHGVAVAPGGALYVADSYNHRILKIDLR
ncbi:MAG: hypothetical protein DMG07_16805 [Acidobacteria bacterium]|nr:MAG: hypothetical protein DMG07_16805 [Acidobacteriota bacterium]